MNKAYLTLSILFLFLSGCQSKPKVDSDELEGAASVEVNQKTREDINVDLINSDGQSIGTATLSEDVEGVTVSVKASHLPPGLRGFHIHENGTCETPDFESAGGHFNPDSRHHGIHHEDGPHAGDLPNLNVQEDGTAHVKYINNRVTLTQGDKHSLRGENGATLIIHGEKDDGISQPTGDAGKRIVCGVISEPLN